MEELKKCIKSFKNTEASGLYNILIEVWKMDALNLQLLEVCNRRLNGGRAKIWVKSEIIPLPKTGDLGDTGNYRRISLTVVAANIYNKLLLNRKRSHLGPLLWISQNGFCPGGSTAAQIVTFRRLIEGVKAKQLQSVITFVDFKKTFDSIHRGKLMEILLVYGVPKKIVDAMSISYKDTVAQVILPDGETDFFEMAADVLQGDTLALHLFIVTLHYALREATKDTSTGFMLEKREGPRKPAVYITDKGFANDLALISNYMEQVQRYFYQDWKWQQKLLCCMYTAKRRSICHLTRMR